MTRRGSAHPVPLTGFEVRRDDGQSYANSDDDRSARNSCGTGFTAVMYLLATVATLMLLSQRHRRQEQRAVRRRDRPLLGETRGHACRIRLTAVSAFGTANALLLMAGRECRTMAQRGDLPPLLRADQQLGRASRRLIVCRRLRP